MACRRLTKKVNGPPPNTSDQASRRARRTSPVRPPNGPLNSHPVNEAARRLIQEATRQAVQRNRQVAVMEAPRSGETRPQAVMSRGPSYLIWNDPQARMLRAGERGNESPLVLPPRGGSADVQGAPRKPRGANDGKEKRERVANRKTARAPSLRRHTGQEPKRSVSSLRSKYRAGETQNPTPPPMQSRVSPSQIDNLQSPRGTSQDAGRASSACGHEADQPVRRRLSLRHRTSQRLQRTASNLGRRLSSSCGASSSSDSDESSATGREQLEETESSLRTRQLLSVRVPGHRRRGPRPVAF